MQRHPAVHIGFRGASQAHFFQPDAAVDGEPLGSKTVAELDRLHTELLSRDAEIERLRTNAGAVFAAEVRSKVVRPMIDHIESMGGLSSDARDLAVCTVTDAEREFVEMLLPDGHPNLVAGSGKR